MTNYEPKFKGAFVDTTGPAPRELRVEDIYLAWDWLENYELGGAESDFEKELAESIHVACKWLESQAKIKKHRDAIVAAKKKYAAEHGISYKQVRVQKGGK